MVSKYRWKNSSHGHCQRWIFGKITYICRAKVRNSFKRNRYETFPGWTSDGKTCAGYLGENVALSHSFEILSRTPWAHYRWGEISGGSKDIGAGTDGIRSALIMEKVIYGNILEKTSGKDLGYKEDLQELL
jgi:hypothetical protein